MSTRILNKYKKSFTRQLDSSDCGVACLLSILKYFGGNESLETLRGQSGTNQNGTTLLGLYQCAEQNGMLPQAVETNINELKKCENPVILHVESGNHSHYIILYPIQKHFHNKTFVVGDPAKGLIKLDENELYKIWISKKALLIEPTDAIKTVKKQNQVKLEWLKTIIKPDLSILIISAVLAIVITVLNMATAAFSQKLVDKILPSRDNILLLSTLLMFFLILIIKLSLSIVRQYIILKQGQQFSNRLIQYFFDKLIKLPKSFFDNRKKGDMISRLADTERIQRNLNYFLSSIFIDILIFIGTASFLIAYSKLLAIITFAFLPLITLTVSRFAKSLKKQQQEVLVSSAINESNYLDIIQGIETIKSFNKELFFGSQVNQIYSDYQYKNFLLGKTGLRFKSYTELIGIFLTLSLFTVSSFLVINHALKIGQMIAVIALVGTLIPSASRLSQISLQIQEMRIVIDRMFEFVGITPEYKNLEKELKIKAQSLQILNISFGFPGRKLLLKNISIEASKGEITTLFGECGSGKSTILYLLQKFYAPTSGEIRVDNINLSDIPTQIWRQSIATVSQEIKIFNGSILFNILLDESQNSSQEVIQFCKECGFDNYFNQLPNGYQTVIGEEGINLSGGQKQILGLVRALYKKPKILFLDEATASMDKETEKFFLDTIMRVKIDLIIIMISHKYQLIEMSDKAYKIENGAEYRKDLSQK